MLVSAIREHRAPWCSASNGSDLIQSRAGASGLGEDIAALGGPDERLWSGIVRGDVLVDGRL